MNAAWVQYRGGQLCSARRVPLLISMCCLRKQTSPASHLLFDSCLWPHITNHQHNIQLCAARYNDSTQNTLLALQQNVKCCKGLLTNHFRTPLLLYRNNPLLLIYFVHFVPQCSPWLILCRKQPSGYHKVASWDENREAPFPQAVSDLSTSTPHMPNKCPALEILLSYRSYTGCGCQRGGPRPP